MTTDTRTVEPAQVEGDGIRGSWVVAVAIATVIVMACGVGVAWQIASSAGSTEAAARWGAVPDDVRSIELSLLPHSSNARGTSAKDRVAAPASAARPPSMFSEQRRSDNAARARLSTYGWSDRAEGSVHIPLARALELYLSREAPLKPNAEPSRARAGAGAPAPEEPR